MPDRRACFVITPIGQENSEVSKRSQRVLEEVIKPALKICHYVPMHAKDLAGLGLITNQVVTHVVSDPLVIADLTGGDASVFYEVALRHAVGKPVIQLVEKDASIPFDMPAVRAISFEIGNPDSTKKAIQEIVKQVHEIERKATPLETPISLAGMLFWMPFPATEKNLSTEMHSSAEKHTEEALEKYLENLTSAVATPNVVKQLIKELKESSRVRLLEDTGDDLDTACLLVKRVQQGGHIYATSSLQHHDADERRTYRTEVNDALRRGVVYSKVICSSSELTLERYQTWMGEFTDKALLIRDGLISPDSFRLLHYPSPMSVDVLISQDSNGECQEMVAGFAGGEGHGGFSTDDKRMVNEWMEIYLREKVIAEAQTHTKAVVDGQRQCHCLEFMKLLEDARQDASHLGRRVRRPGPPSKRSEQTRRDIDITGELAPHSKSRLTQSSKKPTQGKRRNPKQR